MKLVKLGYLVLCVLGIVGQLRAQIDDTASDRIVVVGNVSQPVAWNHRRTIQEAINKAQPNGTVVIPTSYQGTECNPVSTCNPGNVVVIDWRSTQQSNISAASISATQGLQALFPTQPIAWIAPDPTGLCPFADNYLPNGAVQFCSNGTGPALENWGEGNFQDVVIRPPVSPPSDGSIPAWSAARGDWEVAPPPGNYPLKIEVVERSNSIDPQFSSESLYLLTHGGISIVCPWSLDEASNGGNTASGGYAWNNGGNFTGCGQIVQNYLSVANGGNCTTNCPIINLSFPPIQSPASNGNTFTPTYVFSTNWATAVGAAGPQDAVECSTAGGAYRGDSTYLNSVTNVNSTAIASVAQGLPVSSELPYLTAWENFIAATKLHYATLLGNQLGYMRYGSLGPNDELHDFCSAQLITATGVGNIAGLKTLWMNTLGTYKAFETSAYPQSVPMQTAINTEQGGDSSWMTAEAAVAVSYGEGIGFNGVNASDLTASTNWVTTFALYPNVPHEIQTTTQSATDGTGTSGTLTAILPFLQAHVTNQAPTYFEPFTGDGACILVVGYTDGNGCSNSGQFYNLYQTVLPTLFTTGPYVTTPSWANAVSPVGANVCELTADVNLTVNTPTAFCTFPLPAVSKPWGFTCDVLWAITAGTGTNNFALGVNLAQTPRATTQAVATIVTSSSNTATNGVAGISVSGATNVLTGATYTPGATVLPARISGTILASPTKGNFSITGAANGTTATAAVKTGTVCHIF